MVEGLDQIFVTAKHWIIGHAPEGVQTVLSLLLSISAVIGVFGLLFALTTWFERKGLGRIQNRYGPNRVGPFGLFQPIADGVKALTKEDTVPRVADHVIHFLAPVVLLVPVLLAFAVLPVGRNMVMLDLDAGVLFFFAVGGAVEIAVFMAGWSSRNKYSLMGAMRAIAQMISYEVPLILSGVAVIMATGTLSTVAIVEAQSGYSGLIPHWHVLTPWGVAGFTVFVIAALAESNRSPFDLPEAESELVAGYFTEYSGFKFALFFLADYFGMFAMLGMGITLFLGGWNAPLPFLTWVPSWMWFFLKLLGMIFLFIWIRGTMPRMRMDQLMNMAWKFMLPMALINVLVAGIWHYMPGGLTRWIVCGALVVVPYLLLGRALMSAEHVSARTYHFAE